MGTHLAIGCDQGAAYMTLTARTDDALVAVKAEGIAGRIELHETKAEGAMTSTSASGTMTTTTAGMTGQTSPTSPAGTMTMRPVDRIELPAGEAVALRPGGYHVMLIDLTKPLQVGAPIELTLDFEKADDMTITVPVRDDAP
ncbi:MAG: copper chaperone PCu(A)C [Microthrixaceae bacterium]